MAQSAPPPVIVVADDEEDILELVALGLERVGYVVHRAADGEQALALIREHTPDLAILDVAMPKLDGFELTRRLRNDPETNETKIVLLTARVQEADVDAGLAAAKTAGQVVIGFAAETEADPDRLLSLGREKLARKGCDYLVLNRVGWTEGFAAERNEVRILDSAGVIVAEAAGTKMSVAGRILDVVVAGLG